MSPHAQPAIVGRKLQALDGLRGIAITLVFLYHMKGQMPAVNVFFLYLIQYAGVGWVGVDLFFVLSGFLITGILLDTRDASNYFSGFYARRVLRIFPPCYVTVLIVTALASFGLVYNTESYKSLVAAFFYFSNYWNILGLGNLPAGMGILWSLAVEEHYYLLFPPLYAWFVRSSVSRKRQAVCLLALCAGALIWRCCRAAFFHSPWANIYEGTDTRFDSILYGCVLAIVANPRLGDEAPWLKKHANVLALAGALLIALSFTYRNPFFRDTFRYTLNAIGLAPIFFLVTLPEKHFLTRCLEWRVLRRLGQLSYSMYLIHHTFFHHFYHFHRPSLLLATGILVATVLYAQAMRTLIELPLQRARSRLRAKPASKARKAPGSASPNIEVPNEKTPAA